MDIAVTKRFPNRRRWIIIAAFAGLALITTTGLARLRRAAPTVDRASVWVDTVKRGEMLRQVQGQGTLVPEQNFWLSAITAARVEKILIKPGTPVTPDSVVIELANPDLQLQSLEAERQHATATAELVNLQATQRNQRLGQESLVASLRSELEQSRLRAKADLELAQNGFLSDLEMRQSKAKADELGGRVSFEQKRLAALGEGMAAQVSAQRAQVERLRSIAEFKRQNVEALKLRAGAAGVLQEVPVKVGQWVTPGTLLAKVVQPDKLKAEIGVAETLAKDVQNGQRASIDTHNGVVAGHVTRIEPAVQAGTVKIEVALDEPLPKGARPELGVEGTIELERLRDVLYVGRPAFSQNDRPVPMFKLAEDGRHASRVLVKLGRSSVRTVEVISGLREGDQVILSELSQWDSAERIKLQ